MARSKTFEKLLARMEEYENSPEGRERERIRKEEADYKSIVRELIKSLEDTLELDAYNSADISDLGNEIGFVVGRHINEKRMGYEYSSFIHGLNHGIELNEIKKRK